MNEELAVLFDRLATQEYIAKKPGYTFKANVFKKVSKLFRTSNVNVKTLEDALSVVNTAFKSAKTIHAKLTEYFKTGTLRSLSNNQVTKSILEISSVPQIGIVKAKQLVDKGIYSVKELKKHTDLLHNKQKLGLKYYNELINNKSFKAKPIERKEIDSFHTVLKGVSKTTCNFEICGSYRRGAEKSGDIDVLFTDDDPSCFAHMINVLTRDGVLVDHFSQGKTKWMGMGKVPGYSKHRRIDLMYVNRKEFPFAILYFTGSKDFNETMRAYARTKGYTLNEHTIKKIDGNHVEHTITTEADIFKFLGLPYVTPENRNNALKYQNVRSASIKNVQFDVSNKVLLASVYDEAGTDPTGYLASEKLDGIRAIWTGESLRSRTNKLFHAPKWFTAHFPVDTVLDGELFLARNSFEKTASIVMKKTPIDHEWKNITYMVFDLPNNNAAFSERIKKVQTTVAAICKKNKECRVQLVPHTSIKNKGHLQEYYKKILNAGGEGVMLRLPSSKYERKRSKTLLKYKPTTDTEAIIIGTTEGKGKDTGALGALQVKLMSGAQQFKVGTGFTDKQRKSFWIKRNSIIGSVITFSFKGLTARGIPRHPVFMHFRDPLY